MTDPLAITANSRSACMSDSGPCVCSQSRNKESRTVREQTPMTVQLKQMHNRLKTLHLYGSCDCLTYKEKHLNVLIHYRQAQTSTPPSVLSVMSAPVRGSQRNTLFCSFSNNPHFSRLSFCILLKMAETVEMPPSLTPRLTVTYRHAA